jgi:neutral ceramidase
MARADRGTTSGWSPLLGPLTGGPWHLDADSPLLGLDDGRHRADFTVEQRADQQPADPVVGLLAGAAERDLTPPPGMPKAGYSSNAHDGSGFRTRLRARALYLAAGGSTQVVLQCDLLGGSAVLHHLVARALAERTDVTLAGIFIGATHTHAGPGQFLGTDFYNRFASNRPGFDPAWAQFLAVQLADAAAEAYDVRQPAKAAWGSTEVWGYTRNRSLVPHVANASVADKRTEPQRVFVEINPRLHLLRVDAASGDGPLAALVLFSVHGTGISMASREYNADLWAYLTAGLADRVARSTGVRPVVGAVEATHADVAPAIRPGAAGYLEARRIGTGIAEVAASLFEDLEPKLTGAVELASALVEADVAGATGGGAFLPAPARPAVGAALLAGAAENVTPVLHRVPPFRAGWGKRWPRGPQGAKWVLGSRWLQPLVLPRRMFPRLLPLQVLRVGPVAVVAIPFEVTVEAGRRIAGAVRPELAPLGVEDVVVSSVANEYSGYVTTPEEYALQYYEGGHTLYGPATLAFLEGHARAVARNLREGRLSPIGPARSFSLALRRYLARPAGLPAPRRWCGPARFVAPTQAEDGFWELAFVDRAPGDLVWHEPLVAVESQDGHGPWVPATQRGVSVDDAHADIEVTTAGPAEPGHRYRVRWFAPDLRAGRRHRLVVVARSSDGPLEPVVSDPFD